MYYIYFNVATDENMTFEHYDEWEEEITWLAEEAEYDLEVAGNVCYVDDGDSYEED